MAQLAHISVGDTPVDLTGGLAAGCYVAQVRDFGDTVLLYATVDTPPADDADYFLAAGRSYFTFTASDGVAPTWAKAAVDGHVATVALARTDA